MAYSQSALLQRLLRYSKTYLFSQNHTIISLNHSLLKLSTVINIFSPVIHFNLVNRLNKKVQIRMFVSHNMSKYTILTFHRISINTHKSVPIQQQSSAKWLQKCELDITWENENLWNSKSEIKVWESFTSAEGLKRLNV